MADFAGNTIVLTGAGASKPLGYATTAEFFDAELSGLACLYRLHGSLSWIKTGGEIVNQRHCAKTSRPHIYIPPGFKGEPNLEEHGEPIYQAHQHLLRALATASRCIVIGYSFRDPHINVEVQKALYSNKNLTILVVDPNVPDAPESAFTDLSKKNKGRFIHIQQKFGSEAAISELRKYF